VPPRKTMATSGNTRSGLFDHDSVAALAAEAVLSAPQVKGSEALGGLLPFLLTPDPVVEELPALFLPAGSMKVPDARALLEIAVAGKILYAQVRWLDDLADSMGRPVDPPRAVHQLSQALSCEARRRFATALRGSAGEAGFFSSLSDLNARYASSLALDGACRNTVPARMSLGDYVEHAKARAAPLRAPLDALLVLIDTDQEEERKARSCFELAAAAKQLHDDTVDIEEDYRDRRLSWVVSATLHHLGDPDPPLEADEFYEASLLGGFVDRNLAAAEGLYREALVLAVNHFPGCVAFLENGARETRAMKDDLERIVIAHGGAANSTHPSASHPPGEGNSDG
jgi:hypothetical protein